MRFRIAIAILLLGSVSLASEPEEMVTDRPDATESPVSVLPGRVQIEMGTGDIFHDDEDGVETTTTLLPTTLIRIGLFKRTELRIGFAGWINQETETGGNKTEVDGVGDTLLGFKVELAEEKGWRPKIAILFATTLPTGDDAFTTDNTDPRFRFAAAHHLNDRLGLAYNVGMDWDTETDAMGEEDTLSSWLYTASLGITISDLVGAYVEFFGAIPASASGGPANFFDGGFTFLPRHNLQFSIFGGVGLSKAAPDWFGGIGLTFRLPT